MAKVAFIGLGVMGYPMAGHLKTRGGHDLTVYNRTAAKAEKWVAEFGGTAAPTPMEAALLVGIGLLGGIAQIFLTQAYRHAEASTIAPFEYTSILLGIAIGYLLFEDVPTWSMLTGTAIVVSAGIFVILREHSLGLERKAQRKLVTPQG